eukprot:TRINITY_DN20616_c0_g1_i1.p1 TRINITY_DN20616_c0_g1~~TRINITY_DN20616_c0_g1_i1.p1  ORF type:complete len:361 (-),score=34.58 TRINITY_DN20616_c0_g1_i1:111-1100(-)
MTPPQSVQGSMWWFGLFWWLLQRQQRFSYFYRKSIPANVTSVQLSRGKTHYILEGPAETKSRLVVLVHGFVGSHEYFGPLAASLVAAGRRVLRYDNYGRGLSEWDGSPQNDRLFTGQLFELLHALGIGVHDGVDLVGYSMGGAIAATFARTYPQCVASLTLIAPAGCESLKKKPGYRLVSRLVALPGCFYLLGNMIVSGLGKADALGQQWVRTDSDRFKAEITAGIRRIAAERPVLASAAASTLMHFPMGGCSETFAAIGSDCAFPVLVLWGDLDNLCPVEGCVELEASIPRAVVKRKRGHKHCFPIEMAEECSEDILSFFATNASRRS